MEISRIGASPEAPVWIEAYNWPTLCWWSAAALQTCGMLEKTAMDDLRLDWLQLRSERASLLSYGGIGHRCAASRINVFRGG